MYISPVYNWHVCPCQAGPARCLIQPPYQPHNQQQEVLVVFARQCFATCQAFCWLWHVGVVSLSCVWRNHENGDTWAKSVGRDSIEHEYETFTAAEFIMPGLGKWDACFYLSIPSDVFTFDALKQIFLYRFPLFPGWMDSLYPTSIYDSAVITHRWNATGIFTRGRGTARRVDWSISDERRCRLELVHMGS